MSYAGNAYNRTAAVTAAPREVEAQALINSAARLHQICANWDERKQDLSKALLTNRKIWTVFMESMMVDGCPHPKELRENIVNLGVFVVKRTLELDADASPEKVTALIGINQNIAAGLRGRA
jgi:flagellar protein FlaF